MSSKVIADKMLTPAGIAAVFCSAIMPGFSSSERRAAARGLLRHKQHEDRRAPRTKDGLDPAYLELHGRGNAKDKELGEIKMVLTDTFCDLLDVVSALDRIDGGVSLVLRCPGYEPSTKISAENIPIDVFISPRELHDGGKTTTEHVAQIIQAFGENLAVPHLHRYTTRCSVEGVQPLPAPAPGKQLLVDGPSHLPPSSKGSGYIHCRCRPAGTLTKDIAIHKMSELVPSLSKSKEATKPAGTVTDDIVINKMSPLAPSLSKSTEANTKKHDIEIIISDDEDWLSDDEAPVSSYDSEVSTRATKKTILARRKSRADGFHGALISIGPRTDAILDRFKLDHSLIPRIRALINRRRSSDWERNFRSKAWGLTYEAADKLTQAILDDIMAGERLAVAKVEPKSFWGNMFSLFILATILVVLAAIGSA